MKGNPVGPGGLLKSKPTRPNRQLFDRVGFFLRFRDR